MDYNPDKYPSIWDYHGESVNSNQLIKIAREAVKVAPQVRPYLSAKTRFMLYEPAEYKTADYMLNVIEGLVNGVYNNLAFAEQDPEKKKAYQAEADRIELMILRQAVNAQQARQAGDPNLADPKFGIPVNPMPTPQPTPRAGGWTPPPGWKVN